MVKLTPSQIQTPGILVLDEDPTDGAALAQRLSAWGHTVEHVTRSAEAWQLLRDAERGFNDPIHMILVDLDAETFDPVDLIGRCAERTEAMVIAVAGPRHVRAAVEAMKRGAADCLIRPLDDRAVRLVLTQAQQRPSTPNGMRRGTDRSGAADDRV